LFKIKIVFGSDFHYFKEILDKFDNVIGEFSQITLAEDGEQLDKAFGNFGFRKPNKFFWEHTKPFYHKLIGNGKTLISYDRELNQVIKRGYLNNIESSPMSILFDISKSEKLFSINYKKLNKDEHKLIFNSKKQDSNFLFFSIVFKDNKIKAINIVDLFRQRTSIKLDYKKSEFILGNNLFEFTIPNNAELIEEDL
jgi:outer membrane lipoprotein carrier protein